MEIQQEKGIKVSLSVIVPIYNASTYLAECLESLESCGVDDAEFVCIDDGSKDNSLKILKSFSEKDKRFRVISKENEGYGKTMNLGLDLAMGEYIGILESDDVTSPNAFFSLLKAAEASGADIVKGNIRLLSEDRCTECEMYSDFPYNVIIDPMEYPGILTAGLSHWSGIYKREFLNENGIRFNETPGASYQDYSFYFLAVMSTDKMELIPDYVINYRIDNSDSSVHDRRKVFAICDECNFLKEQMERLDLQYVCYDLEPLLRFHAYEWNIRRLTYYFMYQFLERFSGEFRALYDSNMIKKELWDEYSLQRLNLLLNYPEEYYNSLIPITWEELTDSYHRKYFEYGKEGFLFGINQEPGFYVYGAGIVGKKVIAILAENGIDIHSKVKGILVTDSSENSSDVFGIPVMGANDLTMEDRSNHVLVAVGKKNRNEVKKTLKAFGYKNVTVVDEAFYKFFE